MSVFNIETFKQNFIWGGARPNLYKVSIPSLNDGGQIEFLCRATNLPSAPVGKIEVPYAGRKVTVKGDRVFNDWTTTIINDEDWKVRRAIEAWNNDLNLHEENITSGAYNITGGDAVSYKRDAYVRQYTKDGLMIAEYKFVGLFPLDPGQIELAYDSNDVLEEFTVTWGLDYFTSTSPVGRGGITSGSIE